MDHKPKGEALVRFETWNQGLCFCLWCLLAWLSLLCTQRTSRRCERRHTSCRKSDATCRPATNLMRTRPRLACTWPRPCRTLHFWLNSDLPWASLFSNCVTHVQGVCFCLFLHYLHSFFFLGPFVHLASVTIWSLPAGCSSTWPSSSFKCKLKRTEGEDMWRSPSPGQLHKLHQIVIKYLYHPLPVPDPLKITGFARSYII